jgi:hypothetical protein
MEGTKAEPPGPRSTTSRVPASVPSLVQSSAPWASSVAWKNSRLPAVVISWGSEESEPVRMSLTSAVPASVPSVFHNSMPWAGSVAAK